MWISNINKSITGSKHKILRLQYPNLNFNFTADRGAFTQLYLQLQGIGNNYSFNSTPIWQLNVNLQLQQTWLNTFTPQPSSTTLYWDPNNPLDSQGGFDFAAGQWVLPIPDSPMGLAINSDAVLQQRAENSKNNFEKYKEDIIQQIAGAKKPKGKGLEDTSDLLENPFGLLKGLKQAKKDASVALDTANKELLSATTKEGVAAAQTKVAEATQAEADAKKQLRLGRMATAGAALSMAGDVINAIAPNRPEYEGPKGLITLTMDKAYDAIADGLSTIPVWGLLAGGVMKAGAGLGKVVGAIGGGTSGMTTTDAIMGSSFMNLTPWGMLNGFGGKTTDTFTKDEEAFAQVGSSYTGTNALADEALEHANKKYGLYSRGAMHEANALIAEAKRQQNIVSNISDTSQKRNNLRSSMSAIHSTNRTVRRSGGYNLSAMRSGRKGLRISPGMAGRIARVPILLLLGGGIQRREGVIEAPIEEIIEAPVTKVINTPVVEIQEYKLGGILQLGLAILLVSPFGEEVLTYKDGGSLTNLRIIQLVNPIPENIESMQGGGEVADMPDLQLTLIELIDPTLGGDDIVPEEQEGIPLPVPIQPDIPTMRDGGEINIIPDGALHKELHHMEDPEGEWTRKGIPVVDAEGNLVAEIENSEIILRKELIESMEEFTKKYYAKEATKEEKEQLALDAGITLVNEILYNTVDKTNKLL